MKLIITFLQALGYWTQADGVLQLWKAILSFLVIVVWYAVPAIAFLCRQQAGFREVIKALLEMVVIWKILFQTLCIMYYRPTLEKVHHEVQTLLQRCSVDSPFDVRTTIRNVGRYTNWFFKIYLVFDIFAASTYSFVLMIITCVKYVVAEGVPSLSLCVEADFVLFDYAANFWVWLPMALICSLNLLLIDLIACVQDSFSWCMLHHVSCLFKIIRMKVSRLDELGEDEPFGEKLKEIIVMQDVAYRSAEQLKKALSPLLLLLYGSCIISLCITMMVLTIAKGDHQLLIKMLVLVWYIVFQIFSYSMLGNELSDASTSVAGAIYETCWYDRPVTEQRLLMTVIMRSQRGAYLTATEFFVVDRTSFAMAIESAYSYFTVLRQFFASR